MLSSCKRMSICFANFVEEPFEPPHDKTNNVAVRPAKTQISLGIRPVWSESSPSAWRKAGTLAAHWTHSEGSEMSEIFYGIYLTLFVFVLTQFSLTLSKVRT